MNDIALEELPELAKEMVSVIGVEDTIRMVKVYGGMTIAFSDERRPDVGSRRDIIERLIGKKKATAFFRHFANRVLYVPRCVSAINRVRNRQVCTDAASLSVPELAMKYQLSERMIWNILKESADITSAVAPK